MRVVGVILAGGKSTRMKKDKALLEIDGVSLLMRQFQLLEGILGSGNVIVSGDRSGFPCISDQRSKFGPLEGLRSVCDHFVHQQESLNLLVVPVDMPFLTSHGLSRLINQNSDAVISKYIGFQFPFLIHEVKALSKALEELKKSSAADTQSQFSLRSLFGKVEFQEISPEPEKFYLNVNTPEDWHAALS